jgi:antitoxin component of MazEF toxin-antitoxin module
VLVRTYRGDQVTLSVPIQIPANASGSVSVMISDAVKLTQWENRELQVQPAQTRGLPQMMRVLNDTRKNNRLYVRLVTRDGGAVVKGESLAALPPSVLAVLEADRDSGNYRSLQSALQGAWEIPTDFAVTGSRTLDIPLRD